MDDARSDTLSFTFMWSARDHARVSAHLVREQLGRGFGRVLLWIILAFVLVASAVAAIVAWADSDPGTFFSSIVWVVLILALLAFMRWGVGWLQAWRMRRIDPNVHHPFEHILTENGLMVRTHTATVDLSWSGMHDVLELPDYFLFYYNRGVAYFLPKSAIGSAEAVSAVREFVRARVGSKARLQSTPITT